MKNNTARPKNSPIRRPSLMARIIVWIILAMIVGGIALLFANDLRTRGVWALIPFALIAFVSWRQYSNAVAAKKR
jgi:hypothetical protein